MKVEIQDGCTGMGCYINDMHWYKALEDPKIKEEFLFIVMKNILNSDPYNWFEEVFPEPTIEEDLGYCNQCENSVYNKVWEFKDEVLTFTNY